MLSRMHNKLGTAGLIVAVVALIAALTGAAFAAGGLTRSQEKRVKAIAKKVSKPGKRGPAGAPGATGAKGDKGDKGDTGSAGTNGTNGTNGTSPVGTKFAGSKGGCTEGGVEFVGANTTFACNGAKGATGTTGFTETLPAGKTLRGVFASFPTQPLFDISFNIPLTATPTVNVLKEDGTALVGSETNCPGSAAEPKANPGNLCLYANPGMENEVTTVTPFYETEEGFVLSSGFGGGGNGVLIGSWAVTAPTAP